MIDKGLRCLSPAVVALLPAAVSAGLASAATQEVVGPGPAPMDTFHPSVVAGEAQPEPVFGGQVIVHIASLPKHMNYVTENSAVTRRMLYEVHETLLVQDWEYHDYRPRASKDVIVEDMLVLDSDAATLAEYQGKTRRVEVVAAGDEEGRRVESDVIYGTVEETATGYRVTPVSDDGVIAEAMEVPAAHVKQVERGSVFTFTLREGVLWHPSLVFDEATSKALAKQTLDAEDVYFSWTVYSNPEVDCDEKRFQFEKISDAEVIDDLRVRFFYQEQYYVAIDAIGVSMTLLPSHIYNLADPDNPDHDPEASATEQAEHINKNPHNQMWVGIGPYQVTRYSQQFVQADRFDGYFDPTNAGYVDSIRWRYIDDDNTSFQALLNGELDFFERVKSADYFGSATSSEDFTKSFYKGYKYLGTYGFTGWNLYRPALKDVAVRQAMTLAFDFEDYKRTNYRGLCNITTGPFPYNSAAFDHDLEPLPYDPDLAIETLEDAGWYDRNGDGVADKDGVELVIEFMMPSGNDASKNFGLKLQEDMAEIGIKIEIAQFEWATFLEKIRSRDFDGCNLAWVPGLESDPEQVWHSKHGEFEKRSSNLAGLMDDEVDRLIEAGQRELDWAKRQEIWKAMHRRVYEIQPYMFMYNVPQKFAMNKTIRGFQTMAIDPGYVIRRWYFEPGTEGTRPALRAN